MADFYAWSYIVVKREVKDGVTLSETRVEPGEKVDPGKLFPNLEGKKQQTEFDALCLSGAVRQIPYPNDLPLGSDKSPREHLLEKAMREQEWEYEGVGVTAGRGSYFAHDEIEFNAAQKEAEAAREGHPAMEQGYPVAERPPNNPEPNKQANP